MSDWWLRGLLEINRNIIVCFGVICVDWCRFRLVFEVLGLVMNLAIFNSVKDWLISGDF